MLWFSLFIKMYGWKQRQPLPVHPIQKQRCAVLCRCVLVQGNVGSGEQRCFNLLSEKFFCFVAFLQSLPTPSLAFLLGTVLRLMGNHVICSPAAALHALSHVSGQFYPNTLIEVLQLWHKSKKVDFFHDEIKCSDVFFTWKDHVLITVCFFSDGLSCMDQTRCAPAVTPTAALLHPQVNPHFCHL